MHLQCYTGYSTCDSDEFECDNGNCIPQRFVCNDFNSCGDNSDEQNCGMNKCSTKMSMVC